ncbi:MAG: hypothetical protein DMF88_02830 [Acidobacteria bacterium]|nr:MAG: hypothetical protein DMF88_02830 [Acidobacteriota bacterium]
MEIRYLLQVLRAYFGFILSVTLLAGIGGLLTTYILSENYEAAIDILIRPQEQSNFTPTSKELLDFPASYNNPPETISETYAGIMTSPAVATRVVDILHLDTLKTPPDPRWWIRAYHDARDRIKLAVKYTWDFVRFGRVELEDAHTAAVRQVLGALKATPVESTYLFKLTARYKDPNIAALIADSAGKVFIDYTGEAQRNEQGTSAGFLRERLGILDGEISQARRRLQNFETTSKATSLDQQIELMLKASADFRVSYEEANKDFREAGRELASLEASIAGVSEDVHAGTIMTANPVRDALQTELAKDEVQMASLLETHAPAHPDVKALAARIAEAKRRIAEEPEQVRSQDSSSKNPVYQNLYGKLLDRKATRDALEARRQSLDETLRRYQREVAVFTDKQAERARLDLDVQVREDEYKLLNREYAQARLAAAREISEIRALNDAIPPVYPIGPIKLYYTVGGLATGFLLALCLVLMWDYVDPRIRSREDAEQVAGMPVLVTLPTSAVAVSTGAIVGNGTTGSGLLWRGGDHDMWSHQ